MNHNKFINNSLIFLKLCALGLFAGVLGGFVGSLFAYLLSFTTNVREVSPWLILLLPIGSIITYLLYRYFKVDTHRGTNEIIENLKNIEGVIRVRVL